MGIHKEPSVLLRVGIKWRGASKNIQIGPNLEAMKTTLKAFFLWWQQVAIISMAFLFGRNTPHGGSLEAPRKGFLYTWYKKHLTNGVDYC